MFNLSRPLNAELEDFYFQSDDRALIDGCVTALTKESLNVALLSTHTAILEHYGNLLIARLRKFTPTSKIEVYFPTSSEDLLARFNKALANQSLEQAMQGRKNILATQFWVLSNASALPEHELQLLASLVHNFPGANIRLILFFDTSRQANPSLSSFGKNITRWEIALPNATQKEQLIAQAQSSAQQKAIRDFLNRLSTPESPTHKENGKALKSTPRALRVFTQLFAKKHRSMAKATDLTKPTRSWRFLKWASAILALLVLSTGFLYWLYPSAFHWAGLETPSPAALKENTKASTSVKGKTSEAVNGAKSAEVKTAEKAKGAEVALTTGSSKTASEALEELPTEAAAGQTWAKQLPANSYVVQHLTLPVFKNVLAWQQANPKLTQTHIVAIYKPGEKLAQFVLVSGPFASRSVAVEFTHQAQTPRLSFALPSAQLMERLNPRENKTSPPPKEARR